jgi:hypothetical protein
MCPVELVRKAGRVALDDLMVSCPLPSGAPQRKIWVYWGFGNLQTQAVDLPRAFGVRTAVPHLLSDS